MKLTVNTDGASKGNPGLSSYGFVIKDGGQILYKEGKQIGLATNNIAEYTAVLKALEYIKLNLLTKKPLDVNILADSLLIVKQLSGIYKIKNPNLKKIFEKIKKLELDIGDVEYTHIFRELNSEADKMANLAFED